MNLENLKIYKASFRSAIGTIYYLWVGSDRGKEVGNEVSGQVKLSYLGNRKDLFEKEFLLNLEALSSSFYQENYQI